MPIPAEGVLDESVEMSGRLSASRWRCTVVTQDLGDDELKQNLSGGSLIW